MAAGQLAELTGLTTGAITGVIDRLEKSGCARRDRDPNDRRRVIVQPAQGETEREIGPYFSSMARAMAELYARYTDEELALILDFVTRAGAVGQAETARLRSEPAAARGPGRAAAVKRSSRS